MIIVCKLLELTIPTFYKNILNCIDKPPVLQGNEFKIFQDVQSTLPALMKFTKRERKGNHSWTFKGVHLKGSATQTKHLISEFITRSKKNKGGEIQI